MDTKTRQRALDAVTTYLLDHRDDILSDDTYLGAEKWKKFILQAIDQPWILSLLQSINPNIETDSQDSVELRLRILVSEARESRDAFDAGIEIVEELHERNQPLPPLLNKWWCNVEAGSIQRPRRHGPSRHSNWGRDVYIAGAIYMLEVEGIYPTRNDVSTHANSGCDIVAEALNNNFSNFKNSMNYDRVKNIWTKYSKLDSPLSEI
jgi:hypothetical protein